MSQHAISVIEVSLMFTFAAVFAFLYAYEVISTIRTSKSSKQNPTSKPRRAIAIDFDGCLCTDNYPHIGEPNWDVIGAALKEKSLGSGLILYTCREGELLIEAIRACRSWGLEFDAINDSLPDWKSYYGTNPRKIGASVYWDDRAIQMPAVIGGERG